MKKWFLFVIFTMMLFTVFSNCFAVRAETDLPGESVYASPEKQAEIAALLDKKTYTHNGQEVWLLTESITPVYYVDIWKYVENGEWILYPAGYKDGKFFADTSAEETSVYRVKAIYPDGVFARDYTIHVTDTNFEIINDWWEYHNQKQTVSLASYADHKSRIETGPKRHYVGSKIDFLSCTRYVVIGNYGFAFYVKSEEAKEHNYTHEYLVSADSQACIFKIGEKSLDIVHFDTDMKAVADYLSEQKKQPDFSFDKEFPHYRPSTYGLLNIINIREYLETGQNHFYVEVDKRIGYTPSETEVETVVETDNTTANTQKNTESEHVYIGIFGIIAVVLICILGGIYYSKKT